MSAFYFCYFAALGAFAPYWTLYLQSVGHDAVAIGLLMTLFMVSRTVAPVIWGWIADHTHDTTASTRLMRATALLALLTFLPAFADSSLLWLGVVTLAFSFFWNAALPLLEVTVMNRLGANAGAYGRVRLWGSLGFIAAVLALGPVLERSGPGAILPALAALFAALWLASLRLPVVTEAAHATSAHGRFRETLKRPEVLAFLAACLLMQASHGPYYTFFSIHLANHGYDKTAIGALWALAVGAEIVMFLAMPRLFAHIPIRTVLLASFLIAALRWLVIGALPEHTGWMVCAQLLHAASFGAFHAAAIQIVHGLFTGRHQHRGQAIYGSLSFGLGGAAGSYYSGHTWDTLGALPTFGIAALLALGACLAALGMRRQVAGAC